MSNPTMLDSTSSSDLNGVKEYDSDTRWRINKGIIELNSPYSPGWQPWKWLVNHLGETYNLTTLKEIFEGKPNKHLKYAGKSKYLQTLEGQTVLFPDSARVILQVLSSLNNNLTILDDDA